MIFHSVAETIQQLLEQTSCLVAVENIPIISATGRIVVEDVISNIDVPPADNSAMDGYAIRFADIRETKTLPISQRIQAGDARSELTQGSAARIFTGAEIPKGADTVIIQENCKQTDDKLTIQAEVNVGSNIRKQGQDIKNSSCIIEKGTRLRAQEVGLLASIGIASIKTYKPLKVAIVNTGNELIEPGESLKSGQIYNSNRYLLEGMLTQWGFETAHTDVIEDSLQSTKQTLLKIKDQADIIISTGGVSVGDEDYIKPAVTELGELNLWKVSIKPGKPFAFGHINNTPFIGLPGNPASVFVTLLVLARPYLFASQGRKLPDLKPTEILQPALFNSKAGKREEYLRCQLTENGVELESSQSSGVLSSASRGNCLVKQEINSAITKGTLVKVLLYQNLFF